MRSKRDGNGLLLFSIWKKSDSDIALNAEWVSVHLECAMRMIMSDSREFCTVALSANKGERRCSRCNNPLDK
jgi:hypothetical protein